MKADRVWQNAKVFSVALDGTLTEAEAIAVKDGKIIFVGTDKESEQYIGPDLSVVTNCRGASIIPSFVDAHVHLARSVVGFLGKEPEKDCRIFDREGFGTISGIRKGKYTFADVNRALEGRKPRQRIVGACMIRRDTAEEDLEKAILERKGSGKTAAVAVNTVTYLLDGDEFAMCEPYTPEYCAGLGQPAGYAGTLLWQPEELRRSVKEAAAAGFNIRITAHGDRAVRTAVDAILYARENCKDSPARYSVSHCAYVTEEDRRRMAENDITAVIHPGKFELVGRRLSTMEKNVGKKNKKAYPHGSLVSEGVRCAYGFMFDSKNRLDPFAEILEALKKRDGEGVGIREAIQAATIDGAYLFGLEDVTGSIETGKSADFLVLDKDIRKCWRVIRVEQTVFQGRVVSSDRKEDSLRLLETEEWYRAEIRKYRKITNEQEQELAGEIEKGSREAVEKLVESSLLIPINLAAQFKKKMKYVNMDMQDLVGIGNIALMEAAQKFRPGKGALFSTYAYWAVQSAMKDAIAASEKADVKNTEKIGILLKAENECIKKGISSPSNEELAEQAGLTVQEVEQIYSEMQSKRSIDEEIGDGDSDTLFGDTLPAEGTDIIERYEEESRQERQAAGLEELMGCLTEDEKRVIMMLYGIPGDTAGAGEEEEETSGLTYKEVAEKMKISRLDVQCLENSAMRKMKAYVKTSDPFR